VSTNKKLSNMKILLNFTILKIMSSSMICHLLMSSIFFTASVHSFYNYELYLLPFRFW